MSEAGLFTVQHRAYGASLPRGPVFMHSLRKNTEVPSHFRVPKAEVSEATVEFCMAAPSFKHRQKAV